MFFIGIFGIGSKEYPAEDKGGSPGFRCSICGGENTLRRYVRRKYFHILFIPLFFWGDVFFYRCASCGAASGGIGSASGSYRGGTGTGGPGADSHEICGHCGKELDYNGRYRFCPYCGNPL